MMTFEERLTVVNERIRRACLRVGRDPSEVNLVAVSKTHGPQKVREAAECGLSIFGESRVQEASAKISLCPAGLTWHMIGHLQRNKVRAAVALFDMIHSIDSMRLLDSVNEACGQAGRQLPVCLEINVSGEPSKYGIDPDALTGMLEHSSTCANIYVVGLMTIPPWSDDPERSRMFFRKLRELKDFCCGELDYPLDHLSMGMSHDFEVAIEEGATFVRVGTDLFGEREKR